MFEKFFCFQLHLSWILHLHLHSVYLRIQQQQLKPKSFCQPLLQRLIPFGWRRIDVLSWEPSNLPLQILAWFVKSCNSRYRSFSFSLNFYDLLLSLISTLLLNSGLGWRDSWKNFKTTQKSTEVDWRYKRCYTTSFRWNSCNYLQSKKEATADAVERSNEYRYLFTVQDMRNERPDVGSKPSSLFNFFPAISMKSVLLSLLFIIISSFCRHVKKFHLLFT